MSKRKKQKGGNRGIPLAPVPARFRWPLVIGIGGVLIALIGGILLFGGGVSSEAKSPRLVVTPQSYDFGKIPRLGGKVSYDVTVENRGEGPLAITGVGFS